jgi:RNA polymerase sigma-70 factor (ECF subfamily)
MEKQHLFQEGTDLFKWTSKMMYNLFVSNYRRKVKFETQYDPENYLEKESVEAPQDTQVELAKVKEAMSVLSDEHREVLVMVCIQGMRYQDVAEALEVPVGTIRSRLSRARAQLQNILETPTEKETFSFPPAANRAQTQYGMAA